MAGITIERLPLFPPCLGSKLVDPFDESNDFSFTRIFDDAKVDDELAELVCKLMDQRLTRIAKAKKRQLTIGDSLATAELVDDAVLRLLRPNGKAFNDRLHILHTAAKAIEQIALNHLKKKHKGGVFVSSLSNSDPVDHKSVQPAEVEIVQSAILVLERLDPRSALIVRLRDSCCMNFEEIGEEISLSERQVRTLYRQALARLRRIIEDDILE